MQYWPIFLRETDEHVGCCGLRPYDLSKGIYETGFHIRNPKNEASRILLEKLGFRYTHDEYYPPTRLRHPSYLFKAEEYVNLQKRSSK